MISVNIAKTGVKSSNLTKGVAGYQLSADGKQLFIQKAGQNNSGELLLVPATDKLPTDLSNARFNTAALRLAISPVIEWRQMFNDAWRMHRDFLFDKQMRGLDWQATREKYEPLLQRVTDRYELDDLLSQMMGELNALHSQVRGGEYREDPLAPAASSLESC